MIQDALQSYLQTLHTVKKHSHRRQYTRGTLHKNLEILLQLAKTKKQKQKTGLKRGENISKNVETHHYSFSHKNIAA